MPKFVVGFFSGALLATCMSAQQFFPVGALSWDKTMDQIRSNWYAEELKILREPSVWQEARRSRDIVYRFLWLRAFHPPLCVRLEIRGHSASITSKEGQFRGAAAQGKLLRTKTSLVPKSQVDEFLREVAGARFWSTPLPNSDSIGPDGSDWILEAADHGTYKILVQYMPPTSNPVRVLGLMLLFELAHRRVPANSIY